MNARGCFHLVNGRSAVRSRSPAHRSPAPRSDPVTVAIATAGPRPVRRRAAGLIRRQGRTLQVPSSSTHHCPAPGRRVQGRCLSTKTAETSKPGVAYVHCPTSEAPSDHGRGLAVSASAASAAVCLERRLRFGEVRSGRWSAPSSRPRMTARQAPARTLSTRTSSNRSRRGRA